MGILPRKEKLKDESSAHCLKEGTEEDKRKTLFGKRAKLLNGPEPRKKQ